MYFTNIVDNMSKLIYDINNIAPRTNAYISNKLGLYFLGCKRKDFITYNLIKNNKDKYYFEDRSNIVNIYDESYSTINISYDTDKEELYKNIYKNFQKELINFTGETLKIIEQQKNHTIQQCELIKIFKLGDVIDSHDDFTYNIVHLMENSNMVTTLNDGKKWITANSLLEYIPIEYNLYNKKQFASKYEATITSYLQENKINYKHQHTYSDCKDKRCLPFDFIIYNNDEDILIEYNGEQHYKHIPFFGDMKAFELRQKHDKIKKEYAKNHDIKLIVIHHTINTDKKIYDFLKLELF